MAIVKRKKFKGIFSKTILQVILILWAFCQAGPLLWLFYSSFRPSADIRIYPLNLSGSLTLSNYNLYQLYQDTNVSVPNFFKNSAIVTIVSLTLLTIVSLLAGYAIAKIKIPGKNILIFFLIGLLGVPVHSLIIPLFYFISKMGMVSTYLGLALPYVAFNFAFATLLCQTYFRQFPDEIIEAAKIDGCGHLRLFFSVVMPVSMGAVSTILVINFVNIWNEFLFALVVIRDEAHKTIPLGLMYFRGQFKVDWGPMLAVISLSILPSVLLYFIFSRNLMKGMVAGAIKG